MTAYREGYRAKKSGGKQKSDNPYKVGTPAYGEWENGWHRAEIELKREKRELDDDLEL